MNDRIKAAIEELVLKGYDRETVISWINCDVNEADKKVQKVLDEAMDKAKPSSNPHLFYVGGQPGAGKSSAMKRIEGMMKEDGVVSIEMDSYRTLHPRFKEIAKLIYDHNYVNGEINFEGMSNDLVSFTTPFADYVSRKATDVLFASKYNIAKEVTLSTTDWIIEDTKKKREDNPDLTVSVIMMGVSQQTALEGIKVRAYQMETCLKKMIVNAEEKNIEISPVSRGATDIEYYNSVCEKLPASIENVNNSDVFNGNIEIQDRTGEILFSRNRDGSTKDPKKTATAVLNGEMITEKSGTGYQYYGVDAFISENMSSVKKVYNDSESAKEVFIKELEHTNVAMASQVVAYASTLTHLTNLHQESVSRAM